jgi:excisionase family DNA binding protein
MNRKPRVSKVSPHLTIVVDGSNREPLQTSATVAKWLGIAPRTVCLWAACKDIPAIKIGRQWRFRESEILEWLRNPECAKVKYHLKNATAAAEV